VAPPVPVAVPPHTASVHDQLTVVAVRPPAGAAVHDPTVVDRAVSAPVPAPRRPVSGDRTGSRRADRTGSASADRTTSQGRAAARRAAARRHRRGVGPELRRIVPQALIVAFLAGGTLAFVAHDKAVTLSVDGRPRTVHTFADDVGELLDAEGVTVGAHDLVAPGPGTGLDDGDEVAVHRPSAQRGADPGDRHGRTLYG
jgi:resuscitation-promoting factor RpfB